jgi:hypothetical protein
MRVTARVPSQRLRENVVVNGEVSRVEGHLHRTLRVGHGAVTVTTHHEAQQYASLAEQTVDLGVQTATPIVIPGSALPPVVPGYHT